MSGSDNLFESMPVDRRQVLEELKRELVMRRNVFPAWVKNGRLTQSVADHRLTCMQEAVRLIEETT